MVTKLNAVPPLADKSQAEIDAELIDELVGLLKNDAVGYARRLKEVAKELDTRQALIERAVKQQIKELPSEPKGNDDPDKKEQIQRLVQLSQQAKLWHDPDKVGYATVQLGEHVENYRVKGSGFRFWLREEYGKIYQETIQSPYGGMEWVPQIASSNALKEAVDTIDGRAQIIGEEEQWFIRVGRRGNVVYLDLGGPEWEAIKITASNWELVKIPDVAFIRPTGMRALKAPVRGGSIVELWKFVNICEEDRVLYAGMLIEQFNPRGPYPTGFTSGEPGSGKTTTIRVARRITDPNKVDLGKLCEGDDLAVVAKYNWLVPFDNVSKISEPISDDLCRLNSGMGIGKRKLYTDDEQVQIEACRMIWIDGIPEDLATRGDLIDRGVFFKLTGLEDKISEEEYWAEWAEVQPRLLGAFLDGVVGALAGYKGIVAPKNRMVDFAMWAEAGCRGLGFADGAFLAAYTSNRAAAGAIVLEDSPVGRTVKLMIGAGEHFRGKMGDLLRQLACHAIAAGISTSSKEWPQTERALATKLRYLAPLLRQAGLRVSFDLRLNANDKNGVEIGVG